MFNFSFWGRAMEYTPPSHLTVLYTGYGLTFPNQPVYAKVPEASEIPRATMPRKFRWRERPHFYLCWIFHVWSFLGLKNVLVSCFFLNFCIRTSLVKPPARWELQQLNPTIFADGSGGWAWHFLLGPPSFFHPPNCWSEVQSLKNMGKYHDRGFVLEKATPFHPLVDDHFLSMKIATFGEYKHPNSYVMVGLCWLFPLKSHEFHGENLVFNRHKNLRIPSKKNGHLVAATSAPASRPRKARPECTRMYAYIYTYIQRYNYICDYI